MLQLRPELLTWSFNSHLTLTYTMGFNISGIAIDASYEGKLEQLQNDLNITLEYQQDVIFEQASANWTEEGTAFVHFTPKSTLLFLNMEMCTDTYLIPDRKVLVFALSETTMAFCVAYSEGREAKRFIMEHEGRKMSQEGTPFPFEGEVGDTSEIIWRKLDDVLGIPFHSIDLASPSKKFKVRPGKPKTATEKEKPASAKSDVGSKAHQQELELKYRNFSNDQLYAEFRRIASIPNARTNIQCLVEVAALLAIGKERGIDVANSNAETSKKKSGCLSVIAVCVMLMVAVMLYGL